MKLGRRILMLVMIMVLLLSDGSVLAAANTLTMPTALQIIDEEAFYGSTSIDKVVLSDKVTEIRARAFANSTLSEINLPDSITFIAEDAFDGPEKVTVTANEGSWAYNWAVDHNYITPATDVYSVAVSVSKEQSAVGESVTWTATAQNGVEPYKYRFYVYKGNTRKATRAYNASPDYTYTFTESGDYYVSVTCRDDDGETVTIDGGNVHVGEMAITGLTVTSNVTECINDTPVTFTASFEGGTAPFEYEFTLYRDATSVATSGKITDPEYTFTPDEAGLYTVTVKVSDATGAEFTATSDTLTVAGTELAIISVSANADWIRTGEDITWTAVATGGKKPLRYAFDILIDGEEMDGTSFSTSNTTTWTTDTAGIYTVNARVRDANNVRVELVGGEVNVYDALTLNSVTSDVTACKASEDITWTVDREGGKNTVTYEYTVQLNGETVYTKTSVNPKLVYTPMRTGTYTLTVTATDEAEDTATATSGIVAVSEHETSPVEDFTFNVLNGTYCSITGYTGSDTSLFLPLDDGDGHIVQTIAANAFRGKTAIENIVFSSRIESIASSAFEGCTGLTFVDMGSSRVETIEVNAFNGCSNLTDVVLPDDLTSIGACAFANCISLESIVLPDSVSTLYNEVFYGCAKLTTVNFPLDWVTKGHNTSTYISGYIHDRDYGLSNDTYNYGRYSPFANCVKLTKIVVPEGVTKIPDAAFLGMTSLKEIQLPSTLGIIGNGAFAMCSGLTVLNLPRDMATINQYAFRDCTGLTAVNFNSAIATIGTHAFHGCTGLTTIQMPSSIRTMSSYAFSGCTGLTSVDISTGLNNISEGAFNGCTSLTEIEFPSQIKAINHAAFENCSRLVRLQCNGVETISTNAFKGCSKLSDINLPNSLTSIGACAFANCISLESIVLPDSVSTLYNEVFYGCAKLTTVNFPLDWVTKGHNTSTYISGYIHDRDYGLSNDTYNYGRYSPFANCVKLTKIVVPEGVTKIPDAAFLGMTSLKEVQLPSTLTTIGQAALADCPALLAIYISPEVTSIGNYAFKGRTSDFTIHGEVESYAETYANDNNIPFSTEPLTSSKAVLSGSVLDNDYNGISTVSVTIYSDSALTKQVAQVNTNNSGLWTWNGASTGTKYWLHYEKPGYTFSNNDFYVFITGDATVATTIIGTQGTASVGNIALSDSIWTAESDASQKLVTVGTNGSWYVSSAPEWASVYVEPDTTISANSVQAADTSGMRLMRSAAKARSASDIQYTTSDQMVIMLPENMTGNDRSGEIVLSNGVQTGTLNITQKSTTFSNGTLKSVQIASNAPYYVDQTLELSVGASPFIDGIILVENSNLPNGYELFHFTYSDYVLKYLIKYEGKYTFTVGVSISGLIDFDRDNFLSCSDVDSISISVSKADANWGGMIPSDNLLTFLQGYEGFRGEHYISNLTGNYVIGYGHEYTNLSDFSEPISKETARGVMLADLQKYARAVNGFATKHGISFTQNQFDAMVDYAYNFGPAGFQGTTRYEYNFIKMLMNNANNLSAINSAAFCRSIISVNGAGTASEKFGVFRRRMDEAEMFFNGDYSRDYPAAPDWLDITYSCRGSDPGDVWIPAFLGQDYIAVDNDSFSLPSSTRSGISVNVSSNGQWSATSADAWITIGTATGNGNGTLVFGVAANTDEGKRDGNILLTSGQKTMSIEVQQKGTYADMLTLSLRQMEEKHYAGEPINILATTSGGAGLCSFNYTIQAQQNDGSMKYAGSGTVFQALSSLAAIQLKPMDVGRYTIFVTAKDSAGTSITQSMDFSIDMQQLEYIQPASGTCIEDGKPLKIEWKQVDQADEYVIRIRDLTSKQLIVGSESGDGEHLAAYETNYTYSNVGDISKHVLRIWVGAYRNGIRSAQSETLVMIGSQERMSLTIQEDSSVSTRTIGWNLNRSDIAFYEVSIRDTSVALDNGGLLIKNHEMVNADSTEYSFETISKHNYRFWVGAYTKDGVIVAQGMEYVAIDLNIGNGSTMYSFSQDDGCTIVRESYESTSSKVALLRNNTPVTIISGPQNGWYNVQLQNGTTGYIHESMLVDEYDASHNTVFLLKQTVYNVYPEDLYHYDDDTVKRTIETSGCGLCAFVNAVAYMTGNVIDPHYLRDYAIANKKYVTGVGTSHSIYSSFAEAHGSAYGFKYLDEYNNDQTNWSTAIAEVKTALQNGGIAIIPVSHRDGSGGHIMAIGGYDASTDRFLILDSAGTTNWSGYKNGVSWQELKYGKGSNGNYYYFLGDSKANARIGKFILLSPR